MVAFLFPFGLVALRLRWFFLGCLLWLLTFVSTEEVLQFLKRDPTLARADFSSHRLDFYDVPVQDWPLTPTVEVPLRIVAWNVGWGKFGTEEAAEQLARLQPDLVFLAEFRASAPMCRAIKRSEYLKEYHFVGDSEALLSRFPVTRPHTPPPEGLLGGVWQVEIAPGLPITCISVHMLSLNLRTQLLRGWTYEGLREDVEKTRRQLNLLRQALDVYGDEGTVLLGGDFNVPTNYPELRQATSNYTDAFLANGFGWGRTVPVKFPAVRMDMIFVPRNATVHYAGAVPTRHSDHFMTLTEVVVPVDRRSFGEAPGTAVEDSTPPVPRPVSPSDTRSSAKAASAAGPGPIPGSDFAPVPADPLTPPRVAQVPLPEVPGGNAVWGATGRDDRGHIWLGVSVNGGRDASAHLMEYVPTTGEATDRGDVVTELKRAGVYRQGETQATIRTRIVQASDGHLYFASLDEQDAGVEAGPLRPASGGHLWRFRLPENRWEHLLSTPEGLIALAASGRWIYVLGGSQHTLYQYDCKTAAVKSVTVGSVGGHISRGFVCDARGHAYVPRLRRERDLTSRLLDRPLRQVATLVEYDTDLREVKETMLEHYTRSSPASSHGLTAFQPLADGTIIIATTSGYLYRVAPRDGGAADVEPVGWFHRDGERYVPALFSYAGERYLLGLATGNKHNLRPSGGFDWVVRDLRTGASVATRLSVATANPPRLTGSLLYGSMTRDDQGRFYVAGRSDRQTPLLLQVSSP